jgi:hypothetical protein
LFGLTSLLLKLSEEISETGGDGLCSVLCAKTPRDGRLNFVKSTLPRETSL